MRLSEVEFKLLGVVVFRSDGLHLGKNSRWGGSWFLFMGVGVDYLVET